MPRHPPPHAPGCFYHVMSRGNHRQVIFHSARYYEKFERLLADHLARHGVTLHADCLMPNHFHLLVQVGTVPVGIFMQTFLLSYAKWWNAKNHQVGHLFQGRYHSILCDRDEYLKEVVRYIHRNPLEAQLTHCLDDWPWSSFSAYMASPMRPWITTQFILDQFGNRPEIAVKRFVDFHEAGGGVQPSWRVRNGRYVWPDEVNSQKAKSTQSVPSRVYALTPSQKSAPFDDEVVFKMICNHENISPSIVLGRSRLSEVVLMRCAFAEATRRWWGWSTARVGVLLNKTPAAVLKMRARCFPRAPKKVNDIIARWESLWGQGMKVD